MHDKKPLMLVKEKWAFWKKKYKCYTTTARQSGQQSTNLGSVIKILRCDLESADLTILPNAPEVETMMWQFSLNKRCEKGANKPKVKSIIRSTKTKIQKLKAKRPPRYCMFCEKMIPNKLSRHIQRVHKADDRVKTALSVNKNERNLIFQQFRLDGIAVYNRKQAGEVNIKYQRERRRRKTDTDNLIYCSDCNKFILPKSFFCHKRNCKGDRRRKIAPTPVFVLETQERNDGLDLSPEFQEHILSEFRNDRIGNVCRNDATLLKLGDVFYARVKRKKDKRVQVRKTIKSEVRIIGHIYDRALQQKQFNCAFNNSLDIFKRDNFSCLRLAIEKYTSAEDDTIKPGLKQNIYYILKRSSKILRALMISQNKTDVAQEIQNFIDLLDLWKYLIFGDAIYETNKRREVFLRKPAQLPNENDMKIMRTHILDRIETLTKDKLVFFTTSDFVELRDVTLSRLVIENGRNAGEPSRLEISDWNMAKNDEWIDKQNMSHLDEFDRILESYKYTRYGIGFLLEELWCNPCKGNKHLVPLLIPKETEAALDLLSSPDYRKIAGISVDNPSVFANTRQSEDHTSGWHSLHSIMENLPLKEPEKTKSTANRHRISTLLASMD
ncbi:uncharacterized protein LOC130627280 [Hydractinia symbiolongicarpus]|uniref:uncharacterized protein LOC130627280 n=1 Tax=Hydractinia symbiolongicarpus TaxID=13093 RepID=UPI0025501EFB|nr:uncharacterized protein LOC130627280 [Hydractinia symbiolongicarpus]